MGGIIPVGAILRSIEAKKATGIIAVA